MGAALVVEFRSMEETNPMVYLHHGGELLEEVHKTLQDFQQWQLGADNRWNDPAYMAARFCAWAYRESNSLFSSEDVPPNGVSVGIVGSDGWGDAHAIFACDGTDEYTVIRAIDMTFPVDVEMYR